MELFDLMKNIRGTDNEQEIIQSIKSIKEILKGLTEERMCKVYSSYLHEELKKLHVPASIINTMELGIDYEHIFILVSTNIEEKYYLTDLTFKQFHTNENEFTKLLIDGYQIVDDSLFNKYLQIISNNKLDEPIYIDDAFYKVNQIKKR